MSRNANSLPGNPRIKSDPGTQKEIARRSPKFGATGTVTHTHAGVFYEPKRNRAGGSSSICPFGQITRWIDGETSKIGIRGGLITCGPHSWNIPDEEVDPGTFGAWLVSLSVAVTVNMDDDETVLLPGIAGGTKPTAFTSTAYTGAEDYPTGSAPSVPAGTGTIILPIGILTVSSGSVSLVPTGCGSFHLDHCGGTLSYTRGITE